MKCTSPRYTSLQLEACQFLTVWDTSVEWGVMAAIRWERGQVQTPETVQGPQVFIKYNNKAYKISK